MPRLPVERRRALWGAVLCGLCMAGHASVFARPAPPTATTAPTASPAGACGDPATPIGSVQGVEETSPMRETPHVVEGVVTGDFQKTSLNGFFMQEEDDQHDADEKTSEGLFVFGATRDVNVGDVVRVAGNVFEFDGITEIAPVTSLEVCPGKATVTPTTLKLPIADRAHFERYESMLVTIDQPLTVTGNFDLDRYGSLDLSVGGRLYQPTQLAAKGAPALALQRENEGRTIILDDADGRQNPKPIPFKSAENTRRLGDTLPSLTGILEHRFDDYRIEVREPVQFEPGNLRPAPLAVTTNLRIASVNVQNYFLTLDDRKLHCGPKGDQLCRGANTENELRRQRTKLINVLVDLKADVIGLIEIENSASEAVADVVSGLNNLAGAGSYAFVDTGVIGSDAIKTALLYRVARVEPVGAFALLDQRADKRFLDTKNRPVLAQTFEDLDTNARFTLALNHWKSKGSDCNDVGDPDLKDGQGHCNRTRTDAAHAVADWLARDPTHSDDPDRLVIGDLNSYAKEDPIAALEAAGYTSLVGTMLGPEAYSYQFKAQSGYLDHAFANASLLPQVAGVREWHINADEPTALDYNIEYRTDDLYRASDVYRMSDHDPLVVELTLTPVQSLAQKLTLWIGAPAVGFGAAALLLGWLRRRSGRAV